MLTLLGTTGHHMLSPPSTADYHTPTLNIPTTSFIRMWLREARKDHTSVIIVYSKYQDHLIWITINMAKLSGRNHEMPYMHIYTFNGSDETDLVSVIHTRS